MAVLMDGVTYNVRVLYPSVERSFNIPQGQNKGKSLAWSDLDDIFGTEYGYTFSVEADPAHVEDYDAFFEAISAPVGFHTITMPYAQTTITFSAKVTSGKDKYFGIVGGKHRWKQLSVNFYPTEPQRTV